MLEQIIPILLAVFGLSVLIFVHELGHLIAAIRCNMEVESFGIGFGRPIFSFVYRKIRFNLCWIPFGGYVKIVGMESGSELVDTKKRTFFTAKPYQRLKVAIAGPLANILFTFCILCSIWALGGRDKTYSSITNRVGWIDPASELYLKGVRPGDKIISYAGREISSSQDHIQAAMTNGSTVQVQFENLGTYIKPAKRVSCTISPYQVPKAQEGLLTTGVSSPASFVVWNPSISSGLDGSKLSIPSSLLSGIKPFDRIIWIDNVSIFSLDELKEVLHDEALLCTIQRSGEESRGVRQVRVPRIKIADLKLPSEVKGELSDWQYMAGLQGSKFGDLWSIPYNISLDGVIEHALSPIDSLVQYSKYQIDTLNPGDRIVAVNGEPIQHAYEVFAKTQEHKALIIVERDRDAVRSLDPKESLFAKSFPNFEAADASFTAPYGSRAFYDLITSIGTTASEKNVLMPSKKSIGRDMSLVVLDPLTLIDREDFLNHVRGVSQKETRESPGTHNSEYVLGLFGVVDSSFSYNPGPVSLIVKSAKDVAYTLSALVTGDLSPKWMAGPIGIVDSMQHQMVVSGYTESFFWLSMLSMNLAILNLLPLPALDGGYILLSLVEMITGIKPSITTLEKVVFPFVILLIGLFIYLTYNDILRLLLRFF